MAADDLNFDDLLEVITALVALDGVTSCSLDPSEIRTPGVWLRVDSLEPAALDGSLRLTLSVFTIVDKNGSRVRILRSLQELYNAVRPVLEQLGQINGPVITRAGITLPGSSTVLPAFQIPFDLFTINEE